MDVNMPDRTIPFLRAGGQVGQAISANDWSMSSLGPLDAWPDFIRSTLANLLSSPQPTFMAWGPDLLSFFNDAYVPLLGAKATGAIGRPFAELWSDVWPDIEPIVAKALAGEGSKFEDMPLVMTRNGYPEETWWSFTYSPLRDSAGDVHGMICVTTETSEHVRARRQLTVERERFGALFNQAPSFMAMLEGPNHVVTLANPAYLALNNHRDMLGKTVADILPEAVDQGYIAILDEVRRTGVAYTATAARFAVGDHPAERFVDFVYQPIIDHEGAVTGIFVEGSEVTDRVKAQAALHDSEQFLRSVLASSNDCIKVLDLEANLIFMNEGGERIMEVSDFNAIKGCPWPDFWKGEGHETARAAVASAKAGTAANFQGFADTFAGTPRYWDVQVTPILGSDGRPSRILSVSRDISRLKHVEQQRAELIVEMAHRLKNSLTIVQAIVSQTFRQAKTTAEAQEAIGGRLLALAGAQDILTASPVTTVEIHRVVEGALAPHRTGQGRFHITGPDLDLTGQQALGLSLALHELGTNAIKYGALSNDAGRVEIAWSHAGGEVFAFSWTETGGPPVKPPVRTGFGSRLVEKMVAPYFQGKSVLAFDPGGVTFRLTGTLSGPA
jgi:PAS domain S-box-containing protein